MKKYLVRRLVLFFPTLVLASLGIFAIMRVLPGDVALVIIGGGDESNPGTHEQLESLREDLGLNDPLRVQYVRWVWSLVNGEFGGQSLLDDESLATILARRVPVTLQLTFYAVVMSFLISIPMGVVAALFQNRWPDYLVRAVSVSGHALPSFWIALVLLIVMVVYFRWTPPVYYTNLWEDPGTHIAKMIWPALILTFSFSSHVTRVTRSNMLEVLRQDYVRTARSKGLAERVVIVRHSLRNALIPVITLAGLQLSFLLSGTVVLETIFGLPGMGQGIILAASGRDYPVIQSLTMFLVLLMLGLNLTVDLIYGLIDPRIKYS